MSGRHRLNGKERGNFNFLTLNETLLVTLCVRRGGGSADGMEGRCGGARRAGGVAGVSSIHGLPLQHTLGSFINAVFGIFGIRVPLWLSRLSVLPVNTSAPSRSSLLCRRWRVCREWRPAKAPCRICKEGWRSYCQVLPTMRD